MTGQHNDTPPEQEGRMRSALGHSPRGIKLLLSCCCNLDSNNSPAQASKANTSGGLAKRKKWGDLGPLFYFLLFF